MGLVLLVHAVVTFSVALYTALGLRSIPQGSWAAGLTQAGLALAVYQLLFSIRRRGLLSFATWFIGLSWVFMFGQVWIIGLDMRQALFYPLIERYDSALLWRTGLYTLSYMQAIFLGLQFRSGNSSTPCERGVLETHPNVRSLQSVAWCLILFSLPFRLWMDGVNVDAAQRSGTFLAVTTASGFADDIGRLFVPGILTLLAAWRGRPRKSLWVLVFGVGYHLLILSLTGDRRYNAAAILAIVLCFLALRASRPSMKSGVLWMMFGVALLNLLAYVRSIRQGGLVSVSEMLRDWRAFALLNPVLESFAEYGVSFLSVAIAVEWVPAGVPYQRGLSFFGAFLTLLPVGWLFSDFLAQVSVLGLLTRIDGHPVGSSLPAELYANFGWYGILGAFFAGIVLSRIFRLTTDGHDAWRTVLYYAQFYVLINLARASFIEVFRAGLMVWGVPSVLLWLLTRPQVPNLGPPHGMSSAASDAASPWMTPDQRAGGGVHG